MEKFILIFLLVMVFGCLVKDTSVPLVSIDKAIEEEVKNAIIDTLKFDDKCAAVYLTSIDTKVKFKDSLTYEHKIPEDFEKFRTSWMPLKDTFLIVGSTTTLDHRIGFEIELVDREYKVLCVLKTHILNPNMSIERAPEFPSSFAIVPTLSSKLILSKQLEELEPHETLYGHITFETDSVFFFNRNFNSGDIESIESIVNINFESYFKAEYCGG